jgi:hypothetical protein
MGTVDPHASDSSVPIPEDTRPACPSARLVPNPTLPSSRVMLVTSRVPFAEDERADAELDWMMENL